MKLNNTLKAIIELAKQNTDIVIIWLYGSRAKGTATINSDYDLAVAFKTLKGDSRDVKAVTRLASALSKLLLLNPDHADYEEYVFNPAKDLRARVRSQLMELNAQEFSKPMDVGF